MRRLAPIIALPFVLAACGGDAEPAGLKGSHVIADSPGDHADALNARAKKDDQPAGGGDIQALRIDVDDTKLTLRFALADDPQIDAKADERLGPAWFMQIWDSTTAPGEPTYTVAITRDGDKQVGGKWQWKLAACRTTETCTDTPEGAKLSFDDNEVRAEIPLAALPLLKTKFSWTAFSYWNDQADPLTAWSDWVPDAAKPNPGQPTFSSPESRGVFPPPEQKKK